MRSWSAPKVPRLPGTGLPLRLFDTAAERSARPPSRVHGPDVRLRHHALRRHPPRPRQHLPRLRPGQPGVAGRGPRGALHPERHRRGRPAAGACRADRRSTGGTWPSARSSCSATDMEALRILPPREYVGVTEVDRPGRRADRALRDKGATYELDGDVYFDVAAAPKFGSVSGLLRGQMLALFAERGGDPERPGKTHPLDWLLWRAERPAASRPGPRRSATAGPAGTSSAPRSRWTTWAAASTSPAAAPT